MPDLYPYYSDQPNMDEDTDMPKLDYFSTLPSEAEKAYEAQLAMKFTYDMFHQQLDEDCEQQTTRNQPTPKQLIPDLDDQDQPTN
jgi:hypothetical protein